MKTPSLPLLVALLTQLLASCASGPGSSPDSAKLQRIQNIVVINAESHSFDNLYDNLFQGAPGGYLLNHQWLVCACTPRIDNAPDAMRVRPDNNSKLLKKPGSLSADVGAAQIFSDGIGGQATSNGYAVNMSQPSRTVGDTLSAKGIAWAWYAGGWNQAVADGMQAPGVERHVIYHRDPKSPNFQPHHQPFNYFARFAPGSADRARHIKDCGDFMADIAAGRLPAVAFYKPAGRDTQHPSYTDIISGDLHIAGVLDNLRASPQWKDMLVIVTYDENGGYWDHVPPPSGAGWGDRWGPGSRVPALLIGPGVKRGHVDSTSYDTTSILKLITRRFGLEPLPGVRANTGDLSEALQ